MFENKKFSVFVVLSIVIVSLLFVAKTTGLMLDEEDDPDRPPGVQGAFDEADYLLRREAFIALLRGNDPNNAADPSLRVRALKMMENQTVALRESFLKSKGKNIALASPSWLELGPNPIPLGQTSGGRTNVSGRVSAIEIDPADPNKVYVGTAQGGVYRSLDGGTTWTPIFDSALTLAIGALTLDAANNRLWVGTGEANGSADSFAGVGLYRVDNINTTADLVGPFNPIRNYNDSSNNPQSVPAFNGRGISKILISPTDSNTLLVGVAGGVIGIGGNPPFGNVIPPLSMRGLYRLNNAGGAPASATVNRIAVSTTDTGQGLCLDSPCTVNRNVNDMVFDLSDPTGNTLVVWLNGINIAGDGGIYRSTNALSASPTFTQRFITTATSTSNARGQFVVAQLGAGNPARIYVASGEASTGGSNCNSSANNGALRRSTDGGVTWSTQLFGGGGFCGGQCFYNIGFDLLPGGTAATDKLLLGGNVSNTVSGRACARQQSTSSDGAATAFVAHDSQTHADTHVIKFAPSNSSVIYRGDDGGIWKSTDGGNTFVPLNNSTFRATQFQSIALHPTDPDITIGGTQDNGTEKMVTGPIWSHSDDGDGGYAMIDQSTPTTMYHTYFNQTSSQIGMARSTNSGTSWSFLGCSGTGTTNGISCNPAVTTAVNFYAPTALGPGSPNNTVYLGTDRLLRSSTQGTNNVTVSQAPLVSGVAISSIAISPQDDNYRFVGLNNGALFYTTTGSSTLTSLDPTGAGSVIRDFYVARLAFDPTNKNTVYIALGNYAGSTSAANSHVWQVTNLNTTPVLTPINGSGANILPDIPVNGFVVDPLYPSTLYAGTDIGVYVSYDTGANWLPYGTGLPRVAVFDMAIQNVKRVLRIATHGRGMWEAPLSDAVCPAIGISPTTLANGTVGTGYSQTLVAAPGSGYGYSLSSGTLPVGLALNFSTGVISGTPTIPGSYNFRVTASLDTCSGSRDYTITINCPTISISPASLPAGQVGVAYSQSLTVSPAGAYSFSLTAGVLPSGVTINPTTGVISGLPMIAGTYNFTVKADAGNGCSATQTYALVINCPAAITISPASLPGGTTGTPYSQTISATPAGGNYVFTATGALPPGLMLNADTGSLSGTPTTNGVYNFSITATGFGSCASAPKAYSITIGSGGCPTITLPATLPGGTIAQVYSQSVAASPADNYSYTLTGSLPPGVNFINSAPLLFGYPVATGSYTFTVTATLGACSASQSYTVVIGAMFTRISDFDGDGKSDLTIWRGMQSTWTIAQSSDGQTQNVVWGAQYAPYNDVVATGDYDGDGKADVAVFRRGNGHWYIKRSSDGATLDKAFGLATDVPVPADYDGDGKTDIAVWRGSEGRWYIQRSSDGKTQTVLWGGGYAPYNDVPVPADYDGDGKTDIAVFRTGSIGNGHWYIQRSSDGAMVDKYWGLGTDVPVPGDYDGDGKADVAVWRGSDTNWYIVRSSNNSVQTVSWGGSAYGDKPVPGDYDGDGKTDVAIWREPEGTWYVRCSRDGSVMTRLNGQPGDRPVNLRQ